MLSSEHLFAQFNVLFRRARKSMALLRSKIIGAMVFLKKNMKAKQFITY